jgi:GNAT superfamily N-acetyltransferase
LFKSQLETLGRLAVHAEHHGQGLGRLLLGCAVNRCLEARRQVTAYAMVVAAKDEKAKHFYQHYGFTACQHKPLPLYLPLGA